MAHGGLEMTLSIEPRRKGGAPMSQQTVWHTNLRPLNRVSPRDWLPPRRFGCHDDAAACMSSAVSISDRATCRKNGSRTTPAVPRSASIAIAERAAVECAGRLSRQYGRRCNGLRRQA